LQKDPEYSTVELAEICGFGSVNSMKRAVTAKTGLLFSDFKKQIYDDYKKNK
jgi:AraC-like DNA-binding protein